MLHSNRKEDWSKFRALEETHNQHGSKNLKVVVCPTLQLSSVSSATTETDTATASSSLLSQISINSSRTIMKLDQNHHRPLSPSLSSSLVSSSAGSPNSSTMTMMKFPNPASSKSSTGVTALTATTSASSCFPPSLPPWLLMTTTNAIPPSLAPSATLAPISILGGTTAVVFASVLQHPSSTLTPLSFTFMLLLAIQYAIQPRLSKRYIQSSVSKQSLALLEEVLKFSMAAIVLIVQKFRPFRASSSTTPSVFASWTLSSSLAVAALPAMLYALQGVLQYTSHLHLDAVTFNGLSQTKTLFAALCCYCLLGQPQSPVQIVSLFILFISALLFQKPETTNTSSVSTTATVTATKESVLRPNASTPDGAAVSGNSAQEKVEKSASQENTSRLSVFSGQPSSSWWYKGILPCLGATCLSGLAGALSQKGLQMSGLDGKGRNAYVYTMEVSAYSALTLWIPMILGKFKQAASQQQQTSELDKGRPNVDLSWFRDFDRKTMIPVVCKAFTGFLTALVHKHAGTVAKGFALMLGLVLSAMIQSILDMNSLHDGQMVIDQKSSSAVEKIESSAKDNPQQKEQGTAPDDSEQKTTTTQPPRPSGAMSFGKGKSTMSVNQIVATLLVLLSGWLHFTHPPSRPKLTTV